MSWSDPCRWPNCARKVGSGAKGLCGPHYQMARYRLMAADNWPPAKAQTVRDRNGIDVTIVPSVAGGPLEIAGTNAPCGRAPEWLEAPEAKCMYYPRRVDGASFSNPGPCGRSGATVRAEWGYEDFPGPALCEPCYQERLAWLLLKPAWEAERALAEDPCCARWEDCRWSGLSPFTELSLRLGRGPRLDIDRELIKERVDACGSPHGRCLGSLVAAGAA